MAATDAKPVPKKAVAQRIYFDIRDADGDLVTAAASLDSEVSKDGAAFADCTNEATEIAASSGVYFLDLTATEMDADSVVVIVKTGTAGAKTASIFMYPEEPGDIRVDVVQISGDTVAADNLELAFDGTGYAGGTVKQQVDAVAISGDTVAADNAERVFDDTGFNMSNSSIGTVAQAQNVQAIGTNVITGDSLAASAVDEIWAKAMTELAGVPTVTASVLDALRWVFLQMRNEKQTTSSSQALRNDANTANIATAAITLAGGTLTRGEWT
jgi:hypothetical protein